MNWKAWRKYIKEHIHHEFLAEDLTNTPQEYKKLVALAMTLGKWTIPGYVERNRCGMCILKRVEGIECKDCIVNYHCSNPLGFDEKYYNLTKSYCFPTYIETKETKEARGIKKEIIKYLEDLYTKEYRKVFK